MTRTLLLVLPPVLGGLFGGLGPMLYRWVAQQRCQHNALAMAPSGRGMCLDCRKILTVAEFKRRMG